MAQNVLLLETNKLKIMKHPKPTLLTNILILLWGASIAAAMIGMAYLFITIANIFQ